MIIDIALLILVKFVAALDKNQQASQLLNNTEAWKDFLFNAAYSNTLIDSKKLKLINAGAGGTGTRTIHSMFCEMKIPSIHYQTPCNGPNYLGLMLLEKEINCCVKLHGRHKKCELSTNETECHPKVVLQNISNTINTVIENFVFASDAPFVWWLPEVVKKVPNVRFLLTLREPKRWVAKRQGNRDHAFDILCKFEMWDYHDVMHPYDHINCLKYAKNHISEVLVGARYIAANHGGLSTLEDAYLRLNLVNSKLISGDRVLPLVLFEYETKEKNSMFAETRINNFLSLHFNFINSSSKSLNSSDFEYKKIYLS